MITQTVSTRDLQRSAVEVVEKANKSIGPVVIIRNNKPAGAIIGLDLYWKLEVLLARLKRPELVDDETEKSITKAVKDIEEGRSVLVDPRDEYALNKILDI